MGLAGTSNETGFVIWDAHGRTAKSSGYTRNALGRFLRNIRYFLILGIGFIVCIVCLSNLLSLITLVGIVITFIIMIVVCLGRQSDRRLREHREWHAVEHKLINILESNQELTLENLRKASMKRPSWQCLNTRLEKPSDEKLKEAIMIGHQYLELLEEQTLPPLFSSPQQLIDLSIYEIDMMGCELEKGA